MKRLQLHDLFKVFAICLFGFVVAQVGYVQAEEMLKSGIDSKGEESAGGFLNIPLGINRKELDAVGDWIQGDNFVSYKSKQSLHSYPFVVYTRFKDDVAVSARLVLRKFYEYQFYGSRPIPSERINEIGDVKAVYQYCFGERYGKFLSSALGAWGATTSSPQSNSEDTSKKISDAEPWCSESKNEDCQKTGKSSVRIVSFEKSNKLIEFKAVLNEERKSATRSGVLTNLKHYTCVWVVNVSEK